MNNEELIMNNEECNDVGAGLVPAQEKINKINCKRVGAHCYATQKGITLIALIITIIILLILAGVTINVLIGENGLFKTTEKAGEEYIKAGLKEELEAEIVNIQSKKIANGEEIKREDLRELEKIGATINSVGIPAEGVYKEYSFTVDENYVVTIGVKANIVKPKIELTKDTEEILEEITIKVKVTTEEGTIEEVIKPDGTKTTETEFEYKVKENKKYIFEAIGSNGGRAVESIEITNVKEIIAEPIIKSNFGYPVLTSSGIVSNGATTITFDNKAGLENYYSIDNGITWNKYTGSFSVTEPTTIKAKSVKNGVTLAETSISVNTPTDALGVSAYDGDVDTCDWVEPYHPELLYIDNSGQGLKIWIKAGMSGGAYTIHITEDLDDGTTNELVYFEKTVDQVFELSKNVVRLRFTPEQGGAILVYEIQLVN